MLWFLLIPISLIIFNVMTWDSWKNAFLKRGMINVIILVMSFICVFIGSFITRELTPTELYFSHSDKIVAMYDGNPSPFLSNNTTNSYYIYYIAPDGSLKKTVFSLYERNFAGDYAELYEEDRKDAVLKVYYDRSVGAHAKWFMIWPVDGDFEEDDLYLPNGTMKAVEHANK